MDTKEPNTISGEPQAATFGRNLAALFILGLALKIIALPFWGSTFAWDLFIPFLDSFAKAPLENPWSMNAPNMFPYGGALFALLAVPKLIGFWIFGDGALGHSGLSLALLKLPLLVVDILFAVLLSAMAGRRHKAVLLFYWLNPVVFFVNYVHVQLDIVSTFFCAASLFAMIRRRYTASAVAMGLALASKFSVAAIIPLMLAYLWNNFFIADVRRIAPRWLGICGAVAALFFLPNFLSHNFAYVTTASPQAMRIFGIQVLFDEGHVLLAGFGVFLLVLGRMCASTRITDRGLLVAPAIIFGVITLVTDAMPGWYCWSIPFISLFFVLYRTAHRSTFVMLNAAYLLLFVAGDQLGLFETGLSRHLTFTVLQVGLAATLVEIWVLVVSREMPLRGRMRPMVIGVAGDSGSGKDTLVKLIQTTFGPNDVMTIAGDDYHKWERGDRHWGQYTHLSPKANWLDTMSAHAKTLVGGQAVHQPHYDHSTGKFTEPREMRPSKTLVVQGLHALYQNNMREMMDVAIFLSPTSLVRMAWKIQRDVVERKHDLKAVLDSIRRRQSDSTAVIEPQRTVADWIVEHFPRVPCTEEEVIAGKKIEVGVRHYLPNDLPVYDLGENLQAIGCKIAVTHDETRIDRTILEISEGSPSAAEITALAEYMLPNIRQLTRGRHAPTWVGGEAGIAQIIMLLHIARRAS